MSTQHNSEIAREAFNLLIGKCPKGCKGELSVIPEDLEKRKELKSLQDKDMDPNSSISVGKLHFN